MKAQNIIQGLQDDGFDSDQIKMAMCDGEYLGKADIDEETAEEVYNSL